MKKSQPQKQKTLQLIQMQQTLQSRKSNLSTLSQSLTDTKDALRKHRQGQLIQNTNTSISWQNQPPSLFCLSSGGFYHQINVTKLVPYLETRIQVLTKEKKIIEKEIMDLLAKIYDWVKKGIVSGSMLGEEAKGWLKEYAEILDQNNDD